MYEDVIRIPPVVAENTIPAKIDFKLFYDFEYEILVFEHETFIQIAITTQSSFMLTRDSPALYNFKTTSAYQHPLISDAELMKLLYPLINLSIHNFRELLYEANTPLNFDEVYYPSLTREETEPVIRGILGGH